MSADEEFAFDEAGLARALEHLRANAGRDQPPVVAERVLHAPDLLPDEGLGSAAALDLLAPVVLGGATRLGHPGFLAHMDPPTPWVTWAAQLWAAALNQNLLHPDTAPSARLLERQVIDRLAPFFGMDGGHLVPGSSVATLTALWAARELRQVTDVVASVASHVSVRKAANILGLRYREVPVASDQRLRAGDLGDLSRAALVLTAGTVAAGAIDPLDVGLDAAWRHIDAAWAGPLRLSARHRGLLDGVERADSVSFSAHKWLFQPKESGVVLFAAAAAAHEALSFSGGYLSVPNVGVLGSHGAAALPLAVTLLAWGRQGVARRIERCMELAAELAAMIAAQPELELFGPPVTGVVLWRPRHADARAVRDRLTGAFVSLASLEQTLWLRSVAANPMADPRLVVDRVLAAIPAPAA